MATLETLHPNVDCMWNTHPICTCVLVHRATVKDRMQERGMESGMKCGKEIRCKVHHGCRHDRQVYSLAV